MKEIIIWILNEIWAEYINYEHNSVFTCEDARNIDIPWERVKSLLLRNKNKTNFYMIVLNDNKKIDWKILRKLLNEWNLSFTDWVIMEEKTWVKPWHLSPYSLINNHEKDIIVIFDKILENKLIWLHPWQNNNTIVTNINYVLNFLNKIWITYKFENI